MKRRNFIKTSIYIGCAGACGLKLPFANAQELTFTPEEELAMQKFIYKSVDELPKKVRLDICNMCQLHCPVCYMRVDEEKVKTMAKGFGYTSFEQFKDFIERHPFIKEIELSNNGEMFLNPDLDKIIKYSYKKGITLKAANGVNLNTISEKTAEYLVKYKFKEIVVSIDGASPEIYAIYHRGGDFNKVIDNIKMINKFKEKYKSNYPEMTYKFIVFGHNEHEIEKAKIIAKDLNMKMSFDVNYVRWYSPIKDKERAIKLTGITNFDNHFEKYLKNYISGLHSWYFCVDLFNCPQINFNGDLLGCCANYLTPYDANVFKDGLLKALNNKNYLYAKLLLTDFSTKPRKEILCSYCERYDLLKENNYPLRIAENNRRV